MGIEDLSDQQLDAFEANYRRAGQSTGGKYSLAGILLEKQKRRPSAFGVREMAVKILELASVSGDGLVSYGDLWKAFAPERPWKGHETLKIVSNALGGVVHYCVTRELPIITVLVVQAGERKHSMKAIENIYQECKDLGVDVGLDPEAFLVRQLELSRRLTAADLP